MSIGPSTQELDPSPTVLARTEYVAKKTVLAYFERPLHYLFYGTLTCVIVGLLFSVQFPALLYALLLILAGVETIRFFLSNTKAGEPGAQ